MIICICYIYICIDEFKIPRRMLNKLLVQLSLDIENSSDFGIHFRIFCSFIVILINLLFWQKQLFSEEKTFKYSLLGYFPKGVVFP